MIKERNNEIEFILEREDNYEKITQERLNYYRERDE